ncbi:uncharacterized protein LOC111106995 [Crassostrea virginica]
MDIRGSLTWTRRVSRCEAQKDETHGARPAYLSTRCSTIMSGPATHQDQCGCRTSPHVILHCSPSLEERGQPGGAELPPRQRGTDPSGPETEAEKDGRKDPPVLAGI